MDKITLSPYNYFFEHEGDYYIFNSESLFFSKIDPKVYVALKDRDFEFFKENNISTLKDKRIVINEKDKNTYFNHVLTRLLTDSYSGDVMSLIIAPTTGCNFECPYCFEPKKNPKCISKEVEDKLIEYIKKRDDLKKISLTWYGGEPLLMPEAIRRIYDRIVNETDKEICDQEIVTNAFLINDDIVEMLRHCNVTHIQISVDGVEERHNKTRYLKASHAPTFSVIEKNLEKVAQALPDVQISLRVNINKENWRDFVSLYHKYHGEEWHKNIWPYPGIIREDSSDGCVLRHRCFNLSELVDLYKNFHANGVNINFFPRHVSKGCMLQRTNAFIVGPEGELYKCWNDVSNPDKIVGSIMDDDLHNYDLLMKYMQECNPIREECRNCHAFPICDGGCGYKQFRNKFENCEMELCSPFKDKAKLKDALLHCISANDNKDLKPINL